MPYRKSPPPPGLSGRWRTLLDVLRWHVTRSALGVGVVCGVLGFQALVFGAGVVAAVGCGNAGLQIQAQTASGVAVAANAALPILVERYRQEGVDAILDVKARGGSADEARAAIEEVKKSWTPVWQAWEALAAAQHGWATALEQGGDASAALGGLKAAYCSLLFSWPKDVPAIPIAPIQCGEAP